VRLAHSTYDVVVVGGGLVGTAFAAGLGEREHEGRRLGD
jgi:2-polyprenyl-6-methoxyphenol hydroxylase-like FAD-dependent oxidoreductase